MSMLTPKLSMAFCEPASDWNTKPTGTPRLRHSIWVVTCASTQFWVGISQRSMISLVISSRRLTLLTESSEGLIPITESPDP